MDTVDVVPSAGVRPTLLPYAGGPITLKNGDVLAPRQYPGLDSRRGKTLIVTDGNTLLGADDKAGIAEIMTALETFANDPSIPHGTIKIAFTPDEEIGRGADRFDVEGFGADFAYTVDGGDVGLVEFENFNAASAVYTIHGVSVPSRLGQGAHGQRQPRGLRARFPLPGGRGCPSAPRATRAFTIFATCAAAWRNVSFTTSSATTTANASRRASASPPTPPAQLNARYGEGTVALQLVDSYYNMAEVLAGHMDVVRRAEDAYRAWA